MSCGVVALDDDPVARSRVPTIQGDYSKVASEAQSSGRLVERSQAAVLIGLPRREAGEVSTARWSDLVSDRGVPAERILISDSAVSNLRDLVCSEYAVPDTHLVNSTVHVPLEV